MTRGEGVVLVPRPQGGTRYQELVQEYPPLRMTRRTNASTSATLSGSSLATKLENIDAIKRQIMTHGADRHGYAAGVSASKGNFHYQPPLSNAKQNHAVAIVGWDDDKIDADMKAPKPGAWLIKNSWGTKAGDQGYYWISYYDKHCARDPEMGAVSFRNIEPMRYHEFDHHDYHGRRDTLKNVAKAFNAFRAVADQRLQAISFYTAADNV